MSNTTPGGSGRQSSSQRQADQGRGNPAVNQRAERQRTSGQSAREMDQRARHLAQGGTIETDASGRETRTNRTRT